MSWGPRKFTYVAPSKKGGAASLPSCTEYYPDFLQELGFNPDELYKKFYEEFEFAKRTVLDNDGNELYPLNRETCVFSDPDLTEEPPAIWGANNPLHPWTPELEQIRDEIQNKTGHQYNICLCNYYPNCLSTIGWHPDREERGSAAEISSITLGTVRLFQLKENATQKIYDCRLASGSLFIMKDPCQRDYVHRIDKQSEIKTGRINLTFRLFNKDRYEKL